MLGHLQEYSYRWFRFGNRHYDLNDDKHNDDIKLPLKEKKQFRSKCLSVADFRPIWQCSMHWFEDGKQKESMKSAAAERTGWKELNPWSFYLVLVKKVIQVKDPSSRLIMETVMLSCITKDNISRLDFDEVILMLVLEQKDEE